MRFSRIHTPEGARVCVVGDDGTSRPVTFADTGMPVETVQQIIAAGSDVLSRLEVDDTAVTGALLAPLIPHRNIICVGRNYSEHAAEFARSGFDATDNNTNPIPEYPVVFTKPAASVIASGEPVDPHTDITSNLDYEGEIGVIIGKRASKVSKAEAMDYVWGYTLINDVTARNLQQSHKQWFIGKSLDTFCPMGPWAVSADEVDIDDLQLQTRINGELRQDANTAQLIFDIPTIIETLSAGITLEPGDVIATGTPVGVGIGFNPPKFLVPGDEMIVSAAGLGELRNVIGGAEVHESLTRVGSRRLFVEKAGDGQAVVLIHGLGGASTVYEPQVEALSKMRTVLRYDLSGHGRSPVIGPNSIEDWVEELAALLDTEGFGQVDLVAHSMGTLVATTFAAAYPERVSRLVLLGAVRAQNEQAQAATRARARTVREGGMPAVADTIVAAALSVESKATRPVAVAAVRELLLGQDPVGYANACEALAVATEPKFTDIAAPTLLITGDEDKVSPTAVNEQLAELITDSRLEILGGVGHWHTVEDPTRVTALLTDFLNR